MLLSDYYLIDHLSFWKRALLHTIVSLIRKLINSSTWLPRSIPGPQSAPEKHQWNVPSPTTEVIFCLFLLHVKVQIDSCRPVTLTRGQTSTVYIKSGEPCSSSNEPVLVDWCIFVLFQRLAVTIVLLFLETTVCFREILRNIVAWISKKTQCPWNQIVAYSVKW